MTVVRACSGNDQMRPPLFFLADARAVRDRQLDALAAVRALNLPLPLKQFEVMLLRCAFAAIDEFDPPRSGLRIRLLPVRNGNARVTSVWSCFR